jgi:hypothetical protein
MLKAHTSYADNLEADEAIQNGMITCLPKLLVVRGVVHCHLIVRKSRLNLLSGI